MKNKLSLSLAVIAMLFCVIFYSCRKNLDLITAKDDSLVKNELLKSNLQIKREFDKLQIPVDSLRLNEFSDRKSVNVRWEIKWNGNFEKIVRDSVVYTYIPIKAYYKVKSTDKEQEIKDINIKKYLLITVGSNGRSYDLIYTIPNLTKVSKTSGQNVVLVVKNLITGKKHSYFYENNKQINVPRMTSDGSKSKTMSLNSSDGCTSTLFCTYNSICYDGLHVYGTYSYEGYCIQPPYKPGCDDWKLVESREIDKRCDTDPKIPNGPPLPGTGVGVITDPGTPGGQLPDLPYVFIKPDPCVQKLKISANQSSYELRSKAIQVLSKTDGNEWGTTHVLAELPLLDGRETTAGLNYISSTVTSSRNSGFWDFDFTWNPIDGYTIGSTHLHPSNSAPSVDDVFRLIAQMNGDLLSGPQYVIDYYRNNVSSTIVTKDATYVITIRDWDVLKREFDIYNHQYR